MSRYQDWTSALSGITNYLDNKGYSLNQKNFGAELKFINAFCNGKKYRGSQSDRILYTSNNFKEFIATLNELPKDFGTTTKNSSHHK